MKWGDKMEYSEEQYEMMRRLAEGVNCNNLSEEEREMLWYLESRKLAGARVDIEDGLYKLTEPGKAVLSIRQENERRKQAEENEKLQNTVREKADREAERKAEHRFQVWLSFWSALFGAVIGALVSNLDRIVPWIAELITGLFEQG